MPKPATNPEFHQTLVFRSISDPPSYEDRVVFICVPSKPITKKYKKPDPPKTVVRLGILESTGKSGHKFEFDELPVGGDYPLDLYVQPLAWAPLSIESDAIAANFGLPNARAPIADDDDIPEDDEDEGGLASL